MKKDKNLIMRSENFTVSYEWENMEVLDTLNDAFSVAPVQDFLIFSCQNRGRRWLNIYFQFCRCHAYSLLQTCLCARRTSALLVQKHEFL
jgi:hypothetical protein